MIMSDTRQSSRILRSQIQKPPLPQDTEAVGALLKYGHLLAQGQTLEHEITAKSKDGEKQT